MFSVPHTSTDVQTQHNKLKHTHTPKPSVKDTHSGPLAGGLRGICWPARDYVMAARPPPVSCVCAVTRWEGGRGCTGKHRVLHKRTRKKRASKSSGQEGGRGGGGAGEGEKRGRGWKLRQSLFLLCRCFCVSRVEKGDRNRLCEVAG